MSLKRQTVWSMLPLLVVSVVNIFSVPLFYRYLGPEMYALWFYVITFNGMFGFADLGLGGAVGRYIGVALGKRDYASVREYWGTGNLIAIPLLALMGLAFVVLGVMFGPKWFNVPVGKEALLQACFVVGGLSLFLNYYGQFWNILLQAHLDFKFSSILRMVTGVLQIVPAVGLAWATGNPLWVSLWGVLVGLLQLGVLVWYCRRRYQLGLNLCAASRARANEMAAFTGKTFATLMAGSVFGSIDRLVLGKLSPAIDFAHYTICGNVGNRVQGLSVAVMGPVFHNTSRAVGGGHKLSAAAIYDEIFEFTFGWYLLLAIWVGVWHPTLLRLWLGEDLGMKVAPLFTPIVTGFCITAVASISGAQLGPLNRMGTALGFNIAAGLLTVAGVCFGWRVAGVTGVAYGFLFSRIAFIAQDVFIIRLIKAGGWFSARTWKGIAGQAVAGAFFGLAYLGFSRNSFWLLIPAALHGGLVAAWLLRQPLRRFFIRTSPS